MDPDVRSEVRRMLVDARHAGFDLHVSATYRSPEREAMIMARRRGFTHTLTSLHSYGRAIDIVVGDGKLSHPATRARWIAFRRWVIKYKGHRFHVLGAADSTWDWPHVEMPSSRIGFHSVEEAIGRARACTSNVRKRPPCDFRPNL
jgi:hypothetical protein